jgi:F-type H+-transporting ATPase subunit delta
VRPLGRGYLDAVLESTRAKGQLARLVGELETLAGAIERSEPLRQVLADPAVKVATRQGIVADLLAGRALEETAQLVDFLVRTERPADLPAAVVQAASVASHGGEGEPEVAPGGRSVVRELLRGYCERVLQELGSRAEVEEVEDELFRLARILDGAPALRSVLADTALPAEGRIKVLDDLIEAKVRPATLRLGRFVLRSGRLRDLVGIFEWLVELAAAERGRRVAEVRSAIPLEEAETARLAGALERLIGRPVEVRVVVDPAVVGGMLVRVGDLRIDGTIRSRLDKLREALAGSS